MEIRYKEDLDILINEIIQENIKFDEELASLIQRRVEDLYFKDGDIPPSYYINLFFKFQNISIKKNNYLEKQRNFLNKYFYDGASEEEKFLLNNVIFILDILNGMYKKGLFDYIRKGLTLSHFAYMNNKEVKIFINFLTENYLDEKILIDSFRSLIVDFFTFSEIERRSIFVNGLSMLWNSPSIFNNKIWLEIFDELVNLIHILIKKDMIEEEMYVHFFTYHIYGNNIHTIDEWGVFSEKVEKPASIFYKNWGEKYNLSKPKKRVSTKKKKIGFLFDRVVLNSPFMVIYSLFKALLENEDFRNNYEIYVYSMNYIDKCQDDEYWINILKNMGIKYYSNYEMFKNYGYYYPHLQKALHLREKIIEDKIDYLISGFGYDIPNFIFSNRSAPKQIFWSHGNCTSKIENIDLRISHFSQECTEFEWSIFNVPIAEEFLVGNEEDKQRGKILKESLLKQFGEDTVILGTIGRLIKIDSNEYLKVVAEIMRENPNTIYLACGVGNKEKIIEKLKKYNIDENRFIFTGHINPHIFGWVIDVWLDSFPLLQGQSRNEFEAKGGVVVGMKKYYPDVFINSLSKITDKKLLADDEKEYVELANKFIRDEKYRKDVGEIFKKRIKIVNKFDKGEFLNLL
ncbi:hypothetical protein JCM11957_11370 [Caminibacter profundus]